jgi:hypothetical protein
LSELGVRVRRPGRSSTFRSSFFPHQGRGRRIEPVNAHGAGLPGSAVDAHHEVLEATVRVRGDTVERNVPRGRRLARSLRPQPGASRVSRGRPHVRTVAESSRSRVHDPAVSLPQRFPSNPYRSYAVVFEDDHCRAAKVDLHGLPADVDQRVASRILHVQQLVT